MPILLLHFVFNSCSLSPFFVKPLSQAGGSTGCQDEQDVAAVLKELLVTAGVTANQTQGQGAGRA